MGAGKTTIGRLLAQRLDLPFFDSDKEVELRCGAGIPWIFDIEGEDGFRERETYALRELLAKSSAIIATGGGIVKRPENRQLLGRSQAVLVYLQTAVATQLIRTAQDKNRPLLQHADPKRVLTDLLAEREPHYAQLAQVRVSTDTLAPAEVVAEILAQMEQL